MKGKKVLSFMVSSAMTITLATSMAPYVYATTNQASIGTTGYKTLSKAFEWARDYAHASDIFIGYSDKILVLGGTLNAVLVGETDGFIGLKREEGRTALLPVESSTAEKPYTSATATYKDDMVTEQSQAILIRLRQEPQR